MGVEVRWIIPSTLTDNYSKTIISRATAEQGPYQRVSEFDTIRDGAPVTSWTDNSGVRSQFYIAEFFDPTTETKFADYSLGYFPLTPREKRLTDYVLGWIPEVMKPDISEADRSMALRLSLNHFNVRPPETNFNINSFPRNYEQYLIAGAQVQLALLKFLKISIRDFSYGDLGFSINIERGTKISKAIEDLTNIYNQTIEQAKWNFINQGVGLGTIPLSISVGSSLNRGLMNVLDIMQAQSR